MVFDNCGRFVEDRDISDGSPTIIERKECCEEDEPEPNPSGCANWVDSYTLIDPDNNQITMTRQSNNCITWFGDMVNPPFPGAYWTLTIAGMGIFLVSNSADNSNRNNDTGDNTQPIGTYGTGNDAVQIIP